MTQKTALLYARVSSDSQTKNTSLDDQIAEMRRYAAENNFKVKYEIQEDYTGTVAILERKNGKQLRRIIEGHEVDAIVTFTIDRQGRSGWRILEFLDIVLDSGIEFHVVFDEEGNPLGRIISPTDDKMWYGAQNAEKERDKIVRRLARGKKAKVESGKFLGLSAVQPLGYEKIGTGKKSELIINEDEAQTVRLIFEMYNDGQTVVAIARELTAMNIPSKTGESVWTPNMLYKLLRNETYIGIYWHNKYKWISKEKRTLLPKAQWKPVLVPAILDKEVFDKAQERLAQGKGKAKKKYNYLMGRRLVCGICGLAVNGFPHHSIGRKGQKYMKAYYRCNSKQARVTKHKDCTLPQIPVDLVDGKVWAFILELIENPDDFILALQVTQKQSNKANAVYYTQLERIDKQITKYTKELNKLLDAYLKSEAYTLAMLEERKAQYEKSLAEMEVKRQETLTTIRQNSLTDDDIKEFSDTISQWNREYKQLETSEERLAFLRAKRLETAQEEFNYRASWVERLKLEGTLTVEDGKRVLYLRFITGKKRIPLDNDESKNSYAADGSKFITYRIELD